MKEVTIKKEYPVTRPGFFTGGEKWPLLIVNTPCKATNEMCPHFLPGKKCKLGVREIAKWDESMNNIKKQSSVVTPLVTSWSRPNHYIPRLGLYLIGK